MKEVAMKVLELLASSVIAQSFITVAIVLTVCYMTIAELPVHDGIWQALWLVIGFFFGSKLAVARISPPE